MPLSSSLGETPSQEKKKIHGKSIWLSLRIGWRINLIYRKHLEQRLERGKGKTGKEAEEEMAAAAEKGQPPAGDNRSSDASAASKKRDVPISIPSPTTLGHCSIVILETKLARGDAVRSNDDCDSSNASIGFLPKRLLILLLLLRVQDPILDAEKAEIKVLADSVSSEGSSSGPPHCVLTQWHYGRLRQADHLRSGVRDQPDQHGEMLSLLKTQKLPRRGDAHVTGHSGVCIPSPDTRQLGTAIILPTCVSLLSNFRWEAQTDELPRQYQTPESRYHGGRVASRQAAGEARPRHAKCLRAAPGSTFPRLAPAQDHTDCCPGTQSPRQAQMAPGPSSRAQHNQAHCQLSLRPTFPWASLFPSHRHSPWSPALEISKLSPTLPAPSSAASNLSAHSAVLGNVIQAYPRFASLSQRPGPSPQPALPHSTLLPTNLHRLP
ncbi:hypothetical protein AAY473_000254 [Plecturocebus cupreus]